MPFDGQHWVGGMGEPLKVSRVVGHWHGFSRQHARLMARGLLGEPRQGEMGPSAQGGHSLHGREACQHGQGMRRGSSMDGAQGDCSCVRKLPTMSWVCSLRISMSWALRWHGRPHVVACIGGWCCQPTEASTPPLKEHFEPFWKCLEEILPMLEET